MKALKTINSYRELIILIFVIIFLVIKRFSMPLIIIGTISLGFCLYIIKYCINRINSKNEVLLEAYRVKNETFKGKESDRSSSAINESSFKEEIRVLKKVIVYAESCSQFYNYQGSEAESFIDEKCNPFIDLVAPVLAVSPNEYQLVIGARPTLELYTNKKIKEYIKNIPALSDIKTEFSEVYNKFNSNQNNTKSDFNMNAAMCAIYMTDKYGFSQEVLSVAKNINLELYNAIFRIYDQRLRSIESYYDISYEFYKDPENASKLR